MQWYGSKEKKCRYIYGIWKYNWTNKNHKKYKIAAFDLDDTIIKFKRGHYGNNGNNDIELIHPNILSKLNNLFENNYIITIFTNQSGYGNNPKFNKKIWRSKVKKLFSYIVTTLNLNSFNIQIYVAIDYDIYRKPNIGLWYLFLLKNEFDLTGANINKGNMCNNNHLINTDMITKFIKYSDSFYCGDSAGRYGSSTFRKEKKKDFSDVDYKFSINIGLKFLTPEEFILDELPVERNIWSFDPINFLEKYKHNSLLKNFKFQSVKNGELEIIIMMGYPASGKNTFINNYLPNYIEISRDICGSQSKCLKLFETNLKKGKCIVVNNTNPDIKSRESYINIVNKYNNANNAPDRIYNIRCCWMQTSLEIAKHLNNVRHILSFCSHNNNQIEEKISDIVYNIYKKKFQEPTVDEGYTEIIKVPFMLDDTLLNDEYWLKLFKFYSE
jgi:bifunctional polynucleotide phosphatase/kinase